MAWRVGRMDTDSLGGKSDADISAERKTNVSLYTTLIRRRATNML